jgi:hypothetical protein
MSTTSTDKIVLELLSKIDAKKQQIGEAERPSWVTNCSFGYNPEVNTRINIQTVRELETLVEIHAFLTHKYESFLNAASKLGVNEDVKFKYLGFTYEQWEVDIKMRISQLRIKIKKDELLRLEGRVNALVSPEQRRAIESEKLVKEIG